MAVKRVLSLGSLLMLLLAVLSGIAALGAVNPSDGVSVLLLLCEPYGANTNLWFNSFEKAGWDVTIAGLKQTIAPCSPVCDAVEVGVTLDRLTSLDAFDTLVVSTTPGTFRNVAFPAEDLRTSPLALDWVRRADAEGLTLFAGCSGLLVLGDSGILTGRTVVYHPDLARECQSYGATCKQGGTSQLPFIDRNLVTGTNGRYFAQEIAETISWTLDGSAFGEARSGTIDIASLSLQASPIAPGGPMTQGWAIGGSRSDIARAVCPLGDGFVVVGSTFSSPAGTSDLLVIRCDATGAVLWARAVGGAGTDAGEGVCATADGGVVAAGRTTTTSAGVDDLWLVKLDGDGSLVWTRTFGGAGPDAGFDVIATSDGGYAACGRTSAAIGAGSDLFLVKTDGDGHELWTAKAGGLRLERGHGLVEGADGTLYVAGGTTSVGRGNYDAWLAALSATGTLLWEKTYGLSAFDVAEDLVLRRDGSFFLVGSGDVDSVDGNNVLSIRFDGAGAFVAADRIDSQFGFDYGEGAVELDDGGILICGACTSPSTMHNDAWVIRLAPSASIVWKEKLGDPSGNEWASAICRLASGQIAVVGHTLSVGAGGHDVLVYLLDPSWSP